LAAPTQTRGRKSPYPGADAGFAATALALLKIRGDPPVPERDGERCTFVSADGHRCAATGMLEFDHLQPFARGGLPTTNKVRLLCRAHNQLEAERAFGRAFMQQARARSGCEQQTLSFAQLVRPSGAPSLRIAENSRPFCLKYTFSNE
jgi:hypothetical protein